MTYRLVQDGFPISTLRDSLGGIWQREILIQGNAVFTNPANGNRIVVPCAEASRCRCPDQSSRGCAAHRH